eukprot:1099500-Pleurochrysis_carterae.AAC.3
MRCAFTRCDGIRSATLAFALHARVCIAMHGQQMVYRTARWPHSLFTERVLHRACDAEDK